MKRRFFFTLLIILLAFSGQAFAKTLKIGRSSNNIKEEINRLQPIGDYLVARLGEFGYTGSKVVSDISNNNDIFIDMIKDGEVDIVLDSLYSASLYVRKAGMKLLFLVEREGSLYYKSVFFASTESGVNSLEDLKGKIIAFEDPTSTSAFHLPSAHMRSKGLELVKLATYNDAVPEGKVGYIFADRELNVSGWVFFGKVAAGVFSSLDWNTQEDMPPAIKKGLKVIDTSREVPSMFMLVRGDMPDALRRKIEEIMLHIHETEEGRQAMENFKLNRFIKPEGNMKELFMMMAD
jgi:phosphonate transport system substrate-binding protein